MILNSTTSLYDVYVGPDMEQKQTIVDLYNKNFDFVISFKKNESFPNTLEERWYSPMDRSLRRELKSTFGTRYWFDTTTYKEEVELRINTKMDFFKYFFQSIKLHLHQSVFLHYG